MCEQSGERKTLLFTNDVMVFALLVFVFFCTFGRFPKTKHNELILSGRFNVSLLY